MNFFKRSKPKKRETLPVLPAPATMNLRQNPFLNSLSPLSQTEFELYKSLRESVPVIDAAIEKTVRLIGNFEVIADDKAAQGQLDRFMSTVPSRGGNEGIYSFITAYFEELLTYGQSVGEIVLTGDGSDIGALYIANFNDVEIKNDGNPLELIVCPKGSGKPVAYQGLIIPTLLKPQSGTVKGTSILKGLPFVSSILLKIFNSIGTNWERVGNIRYAVTYKPDTGSASITASQVQEIADQWSRAMRSSEVCDFVSVGDVNIKVIGADNQILDCDIPIRHLMEQIIAKLSIPPFMLGISWSSTERMSAQQADILTSELEYYRSLITPVIRKIAETFLMLNGFGSGVEVKWNLINLQDELELSQARLNNAQALEIEERVNREYKLEVEYENGSSY